MSRPLLVAAVLALALTACSDDDAPDPSAAPVASPSASPTASSAGPTTGPDEVDDGRQAVTLDAALRGPAPTDLRLLVSAPRGCVPEDLTARVEESRAQVAVTLTAAPGPAACPDVDVPPESFEVVLSLQDPLAERAVLDTATGRPVTVAQGTPPGPAPSPLPVRTGG